MTVNNHDVRDLIDQALPRLQAMLAEQGLNLSEVQINVDANRRQSSHQPQEAQELFNPAAEEDALITPLKSNKKIKGLGNYSPLYATACRTVVNELYLEKN
ncbi:MAG: flagellar hook-length control protein FliK [Legionella sp.]